jgi:hypothetical protein
MIHLPAHVAADVFVQKNASSMAKQLTQAWQESPLS